MANEQVDHKVTIKPAEGFEARAGFTHYGECECNNPDGNGDGREDYLGYSEDEILDLHDAHLEKLGLFATAV